jgi:hypothetical protein
MTEPIKQPEALRLADALDDEFVSGRISNDTGRKASAELRRLHGEVERLRADAERYRWLRECARATSEHWGGRWSLVTEGPAPENATPAGIDAAIDAARNALKEPK